MDVSLLQSIADIYFYDSPDMIVVLDNKLQVIEVNRSFLEATQSSKDDVIGHDAQHVLGERFSALQHGLFEALSGKPSEVEYQESNEQGNMLHLCSKLQPLARAGEVFGVLISTSIADDENQNSGIQTQSIYEKIVEIVPGILFVKDADERMIFGGKHFADYIGVTPEEIFGRNCAEVMTEEEAELIRIKDRIVLSQNKTVVYEEKLRRADGTFRTHYTKKVPLSDKDGNVVGLVGICTDIQDLKDAELSIKKLSTAIAKAPSPVMFLDADLTIETVNTVFSAVVGYPSEFLLEKNISFLLADDTKDVFIREWSEYFAWPNTDCWITGLKLKNDAAEIFSCTAYISPIYNEDNELNAYAVVLEQ